MDTYAAEAAAELQALSKIFTRTYIGDNGEVVVVVGTREHCGPQEYVEAEFVFEGGVLKAAHIGAAGDDCVAKTHQEETYE